MVMEINKFMEKAQSKRNYLSIQLRKMERRCIHELLDIEDDIVITVYSTLIFININMKQIILTYNMMIFKDNLIMTPEEVLELVNIILILSRSNISIYDFIYNKETKKSYKIFYYNKLDEKQIVKHGIGCKRNVYI